VDNFISEKASNMEVETNDGALVLFEQGFWTVDAGASQFEETGNSFL
jgi:hypothetical protein